MNIQERFAKYYASLNIPKPDLNSFSKMDFRFRLGIIIDFLEANNLILICSNLGYKIKKRDAQFNAVPYFIKEEFLGEPKDILEVYKLGVNDCFNIIQNPF